MSLTSSTSKNGAPSTKGKDLLDSPTTKGQTLPSVNNSHFTLLSKAFIFIIPIFLAVSAYHSSLLEPGIFGSISNHSFEDEIYTKDRVFKSRAYADVLKSKGEEYAAIPARNARPECPIASHYKLVRVGFNM
jgi:hypothetical protein